MLAEVPGDGDEGTAQGGLPVKHFLPIVGIRVIKSKNRLPEVGEGILKGLPGPNSGI
jgi:hypothetical protein